MRFKIISLVLLSLGTLACGFSIPRPEPVTPGVEITDQITVPASTSGEKRVRLEFGVGVLKIAGGESEHLLAGTVTYNIPALKPEISISENEILVKQGKYDFKVVPDPSRIKNEWDFKLASTPIDLEIVAGAYKAQYEFGSLALTQLMIKDGAANVTLNFSTPNQAEMRLFRYETGASNVVMRGLANANFSSFIFKSGAGTYTLAFDGQVQREGIATIESGLSNVILMIPQGQSAILIVESGLTNINIGPEWQREGNRYIQSGSGPTLTFVIKMGAGNLTVTH